MAHPEGTQCTTMTSGGRKKMHYTYPDGSEMVDEFDVQTDALLVRKKRRKTMLGALGDWVYEARARRRGAGQPHRAPQRTATPAASARASQHTPSRWARRRRASPSRTTRCERAAATRCSCGRTASTPLSGAYATCPIQSRRTRSRWTRRARHILPPSAPRHPRHPCAGLTPRSGHAADRRAHELLLLNYFSI